MSGTNIKIYKNDELLHDCTLCQNPDGRIGWWDAVDGTFHPREEEPTIREPMWAQYIDTGVSALRKQIVPDTNVAQTNADHIRSLSDDELAEFLCGVYDDENCGVYQDECGKFICGVTIIDYDQYKIVDWLKQPYGGDT